MDTVSVRCNHCGAPLDVGTQTRFVTCQFCHSQLEVKRNESSVFTEEVAKIARNTEQMAESLEVIKLQNEIELLDREAGTRLAAAAPEDRGAGPPSVGSSLVGFAFAVFFAIVCFGMAGMAGSSGAPGLFALVPVGMGIFALVAAVMGIAKSLSQTDQQDNYLQRRGELLRKLAELKKD